MLIVITQGMYAYRDEHDNLSPKEPKDGPFNVADEEGARLISLGVAEEAVATVDTAFEEHDPSASTGNQAISAGEPYSADMKATDLKKLLSDAGISFHVGMSKAAMVDALDAYYAQTNAEESESPMVNGSDGGDIVI